MKILIVDDSRFIRLKIRQFIEQLGYNVAGEAKDGLEAVKMYKTLKPDVVLSDLEMPNLDGYGMLGQIKEFDNNAKIIMITSVVNTQAIQKLISLGAVEVVQKPVDLQKIDIILKKI